MNILVYFGEPQRGTSDGSVEIPLKIVTSEGHIMNTTVTVDFSSTPTTALSALKAEGRRKLEEHIGRVITVGDKVYQIGGISQF